MGPASSAVIGWQFDMPSLGLGVAHNVRLEEAVWLDLAWEIRWGDRRNAGTVETRWEVTEGLVQVGASFLSLEMG